MLLKTFVKVGHISNLSDARYCASMGVDLLGFCLDPKSEDYILPQQVKEIIGWVSGPESIVDYGTLNFDAIQSIKNDLVLDYAQTSDLAVATQLAQSGHSVILNVGIKGLGDLDKIQTYDPVISYLEISCKNEQLYGPIATHLINNDIATPVLKNYNNTVGTVALTCSDNAFHGIVLKGSKEDQPGFKDYEDLADILEVLEMN